jgi:hypothetical protein
MRKLLFWLRFATITVVSVMAVIGVLISTNTPTINAHVR